MCISTENISQLTLSIKYSFQKDDKVQNSLISDILLLEKDNDYIEFEFCGFIVKEFQESKALLRLKPLKQGTFRFESLLFSVFNIPRRFDFDSINGNNRNYNSILTSNKGFREYWCSQYKCHFSQ